MAAIQIGGNFQARVSSSGSGVVEDLLVGVERFARPVPSDLREEPVFDRVPLRSTGGVVRNGYAENKGIGQLGLHFRFPSMTSATVAAARIGENEQLA